MSNLMSIVLLLLVYTLPSQAYLDPGTGSMLFSIIIAMIATVIYTAKNFFFKFQFYINRLFFKKMIVKKNTQVVIYNEGEQYFTTFYPILKELESRNIEFQYLYSEKNDSVVQYMNNIDSQYIGKGNKAFYYLNTLEADLCIMTTPGLDVLQIKRSKGVKHYCHISHSAAGCAGYEVFGIDYFDSILTTNNEDKKFIENLESLRKLPAKEVYVVGNPYLDMLSQELEKIQVDKSNKLIILLSPTWGKTGLLSKYGEELIRLLSSNTKFHIIIRPHPQSVRYETEVLRRLESLFADSNNVEWDYSNHSLNAMKRANIMVSDFSGIIFDFIFLFSKPVISIPTSITMKGKDYIDINTPLWQIDFFYQNTHVLSENEILNINHIIQECLEENKSRDQEIHEKYNPYSKYASKVAVDAIESILVNLKRRDLK